MSYKLEGKDIVISGFEEGIADSPYAGIADIRNINLTSVPGEANVNFKTQAMTLPPAVNALAFTVTNAGDLFTVASTTGWYAGMAIVFNTIVSATGFSTGVVYYVGNITATTFQIFPNPFYAVNNFLPVTVTADGSGTLSTYQMAKPIDSCLGNNEFFSTTGYRETYIIDSKNQVWVLVPPVGISAWPANTAIFCGNISSTISAGPSSIAVWSGYLFLFRSGATDVWEISDQDPPASNWTYSWNGIQTTGTTSRKCLVGQDDAIYVCNGNAIASILENAGEIFDPSDNTTYTATNEALLLPEGEAALCLAELGTNLLIGGVRSFVYPWDRVSTSYSYPIVVPERYISMIIATQSNAFIFAGNRGYIYVTNGANVDVFKKIPDHLSGVMQPYYTFGGNGSTSATTANGSIPSGDGKYWRNQIYFSLKTQTNAGTLITTTTGIWAIDLDTKALRLVLKMSYDAYSGGIGVISPMSAPLIVGGEGLYAGWVDANGNLGIDATISTPYTNYESSIELDMIPVGTYLDPFSPSQVEWKTSRPLVSGEAVRLSYRLNLTDSYTVIDDDGHSSGVSDTVGATSDMIQVNFQKAQWVQLKVETKSTASSPSHVPVTEVRIRDWPSGKNARG